MRGSDAELETGTAAGDDSCNGSGAAAVLGRGDGLAQPARTAETVQTTIGPDRQPGRVEENEPN